MGIVIELLKENNLHGLKELYENAFEESHTDLNAATATFEKIRNNSCYNILVAKDGEKVVGSVMGLACYELFGSCKPFMVVENVAVLQSHRRKGIAKMLFERLEEIARSLECSAILFVSSEHRLGAHKLYESLGYGQDKVNGYRKRLNF
jgi:predicted N-acetyltransferase YhbS